MTRLDKLQVKLFADGADITSIKQYRKNPLISGFTTNPTLMRKAGVTNYLSFVDQALSLIPDLPISFEVLSDDFSEMCRQACIIAERGKNVVVKIPITNTKGEFAGPLIRELLESGVTVNATAVLSLAQVEALLPYLPENKESMVSIFAGRIADTGVDPKPIMKAAVAMLANKPCTELIWASPRQLYNLFDANDIGCHIITMTYDLLKKLPLIGKDLHEFSLETVQMFYDDATQAGLTIDENMPEESIIEA